MNPFFGTQPAEEEKAGYNQAARITDILAMLRLTFTSAMMDNPNDLSQALESCRGTLNVISGKVNEEQIKRLSRLVYRIEVLLPSANATYTNSTNGNKYFKNLDVRLKLKRIIENLWRDIEKTQDEYGYGMFSEDDSGL